MDGKTISTLGVTILFRKIAIASLLAVALPTLLSGCAPQPPTDAAALAKDSQSGYEMTMRERWTDKPYRELVKHMGREGLVMDIPRYGWPPSSAVVYGINDATGCIDSFLVVHGKDPVIKDYFCR